MGGPLAPLRRALFWAHLALGAAAGAAILVMCVTGTLLALERPLVAWAESAPPPSSPERPPLDALVARAEAAGGRPAEWVLLRADASAPVTAGFGREETLLVSRSGEVSPGASRLRRAFHSLEDWHRRLGARGSWRDAGRAAAGAGNAAFLLLALSGLVLWWPRRRTPAALRAAALPSLKGRGKARDWNWHNAFGVWAAPALIVVAAGGVVISYPWASGLVYRAAGEAPPPPRTGPRPAGPRSDAAPPPAAWGAAAAAVAARAPGWTSAVLRRAPDGGLSASIEEAGRPYYLRSTLVLDAAGAERRWEPVSGWSRGRRWRVLARFAHTGEAGGLAGRWAAALATAAGAVLVWTGLALAWRRLRSALRRNSPVTSVS